MRNQIFPWGFCKSLSISSIPIQVPRQFLNNLSPHLINLNCSRKTNFLSILAFSVPFSSLCCSKTCIKAFFVKITEVLPTLFSAKTSELTQLFKTSPIRQTTKLKTLKVYPLFSKKQIIKKLDIAQKKDIYKPSLQFRKDIKQKEYEKRQKNKGCKHALSWEA